MVFRKKHYHCWYQQLNQKGIPAELKNIEKRDERSTFYVQDKDDDLMLVSYVDKKKS